MKSVLKATGHSIDYTETSIFCKFVVLISNLFKDFVEESFVYKKMKDTTEAVRDVKAVHLGILILILALVHSKLLLGTFLSGIINLSLFFYGFIFIAILFLITPLRLREISKTSLFIKMLRN